MWARSIPALHKWIYSKYKAVIRLNRKGYIMVLNQDIILTLAGLTLTFYALFARMLVRFNDRYSRSLLYFLLANMVSVGFTVVFVLSSLSKGIEQYFSYLSNILDISWTFALVTVILFAAILLNRELSEIDNPEDKRKRLMNVIVIILFSFVLFLVLPLFLSIF